MSGWLNGWCRRPDPDAAPIDLICMAGDARLLDSVDFVPGALFSRLLLPFCCAPFTGAPCARSISPTALVLTDWMLHVAAANQHLRLLGPSIEQSAASAEGHGHHFCCRPIGLTTFINGPLTRFIRRRMALHNRCSWPSDGLHLRLPQRHGNNINDDGGRVETRLLTEVDGSSYRPKKMPIRPSQAAESMLPLGRLPAAF